MNLMTKYLGIMKHNKEYIINIGTDANIPAAISHFSFVKDLNKKALPGDGGISENFKRINIPDKSDKTTAWPDDLLPELKSFVPAHTSRTWGFEMQELIEWYKTIPKPRGAFSLDVCRQVVDPEKFFTKIDRRIDAGPTKLEDRYGNLQDDLRRLRRIFEAEK
jgi:hypothetical protein